MSVYVDDMYLLPMGRFGRMKMSHMIADTKDELHRMADTIGLPRRWFQGDHYDVSMSMRKLAIEAGAVPTSLNQVGRMVMAVRRAKALGMAAPNSPPTPPGALATPPARST